MLRFVLISFFLAVTLGCDVPDLVYQELDCKLISEKNGCPVAYDCSNIEQRNKDATKCYFHGKTYNIGEKIPEDETYPNCKSGCQCSGYETAKITCGPISCPEWHGYKADPYCHLKYHEDKCCSEGQVCPPFNVTCEVGGKKYFEAQLFTLPGYKCVQCTCKKGFPADGTFDDNFCRKTTCISELYHGHEIQKFCAPSYRARAECCPVRWICPTDQDKIEPGETNSDSTDLKCKFGTKTLNYGDHFIRSHSNGGKVTCTCLVPPYLTCRQDLKYPIF